jgi:hypothetical protein
MNLDLSINTDLVRHILTRFIRSEITRTGISRAVLGRLIWPSMRWVRKTCWPCVCLTRPPRRIPSTMLNW